MANDFAVLETMKRVTHENLNMKFWATRDVGGCGTTMCLAGHAVEAFGHELVWEPEYALVPHPEGGYLVSSTDQIASYKAVKTADGEWVEDLAQEILGLDDDEAAHLFFATDLGNDVDALWELVTDVTGVQRPDAA